MNRGQKFDAASAERELACKSTSFYFALLALPGSGAFKIFHPVLFKRALDTLKLASKLHLERYFVFGSGNPIGILMEVSILFSILDGPGRRGRLILFPTELKAADMGISVRDACL